MPETAPYIDEDQSLLDGDLTQLIDQIDNTKLRKMTSKPDDDISQLTTVNDLSVSQASQTKVIETHQAATITDFDSDAESDGNLSDLSQDSANHPRIFTNLSNSNLQADFHPQFTRKTTKSRKLKLALCTLKGKVLLTQTNRAQLTFLKDEYA